MWRKQRSSVLRYYKNPKAFRKQVRIIDPSSDTLELRKDSNLTFGGYLAGTTPMFSIRFSLFVVQVLLQACKDCVAHWWFFGIINLRHLWERTATCKPYKRFSDKELHGTHSLNGKHQQRSGRQTMWNYTWQTCSDSRRGRGAPHSAKSRSGGAVASKERKAP